MIELLIATQNKGKLREIKDLLKDLPYHVTSLADYPDAPEIIEDGKTFTQNALKKAATIALYTRKLTMGEDSGLQVAALGNRPGIYSARYAGETATDEDNNRKLVRDLKGIPFEQRRARYQCHAALVDGQRVIEVVKGTCSGMILESPRGHNGFGYDPYFYLPRYDKTFGELDPTVKAKISHRARALRKLRKCLEDYARSLDVS